MYSMWKVTSEEMTISKQMPACHCNYTFSGFHAVFFFLIKHRVNAALKVSEMLNLNFAKAGE